MCGCQGSQPPVQTLGQPVGKPETTRPVVKQREVGGRVAGTPWQGAAARPDRRPVTASK